MKVRGKPDGGVPTMRDETDAELPRHQGNAPLLADSPYFGHVGLDDVERPRFEPWPEGLPPRQNLASRDGSQEVIL